MLGPSELVKDLLDLPGIPVDRDRGGNLQIGLFRKRVQIRLERCANVFPELGLIVDFERNLEVFDFFIGLQK